MDLRLPILQARRPIEKVAAPLEVRNLTAGYGKLMVLHDISLGVAPGEAVALLGANGAGKTTVLRAITGLTAPKQGSVLWGDQDLAGARPDVILRHGIAHVPQGRQVFAEQTVLENLLIGAHLRSDQAAISEDLHYVLGVFPVLREKLKDKAGSLSGGQQGALVVGRAMMSDPSLLLLDEPTLGLAPKVVDTLADVLRTIRRDRGVGMLLVEQDALFALDLTTRAYVLQRGVITSEQSSSDLANDPEVVFAYLGGESPSLD
jgi:branched-chain amino acid transport system ATP-binding protein